MKQKDDKITIEWDYKIPKEYNIFDDAQNDWNQTLVTKINEIAIYRSQYYDKKGIKKPDSPLKVPLQFVNLLNSLVYYDKKNNILGGRYNVLLMWSTVDYIELDGFKVKILNYEENKINMKDKQTEKITVELEKNESKDMTAITSKGEGLRFNKGKLRYDLVEPRAHRDMVKVLTYGATKYFDRNWENGFSWTSIIASAKRHLAAIEAGEDYDYDPNCEGCKAGNCKNHSGELHVANLACNAHFLNAFYYTFPQGDDRPKRFLKIPKIGLDIDGVIADFTGAWNKLFPEISIEPNSWYFDRKMSERFEKMKLDGILDEFYLNIEPMINPEDLPFEPHCYITSRPVSTEITEQWLDKYHFPAKKVYSIDVCQSKVEVAKNSGIDIFIDDSFDNFVDLNNSGIFTYLITATYNKSHDVGHMRINSLNDIPVLKY